MSSCLSHASCISYFKPDADGSNSTGFSPDNDNDDVWDPPTDPNGAAILEMKPRAQLVAQLRGSRDLSHQMSWGRGSGAAGYGVSGGGGVYGSGSRDQGAATFRNDPTSGAAGYGNDPRGSGGMRGGDNDQGYTEYQQAM